MEFGAQEIFLNATGQISVMEMVKIAQQMYVDSKMQIPDELDSIIIDELEGMVSEIAIIEYKDSKLNFQMIFCTR